ncbi:MAG: gamma-glutamyl-gamma-aminobutyrate hydrolase family protein [Bacteroidales bacterium]|nr:gamma-glutamyl-gamma-aminobutyrate hydrolase family protein [Bacteroidales bacterium]MCM1146658.1 gamma-glutamyl-gamma-aminobutyrate hydrolase family protein [Bacteroidales bacterium]MCM1206049.1 gamma-glutamyl-gamma-aminobutyrate hydrolase family protein [Bacillota bacterium]MCM1511050.1 gamma-glutamyl-gamma-aminobutyrate hydrolase family protein [Clostridium sp.]
MLDRLLDPIYNGCRETACRPIIGITTNAGGEDFSLRQRYCEQVEHAGGVPVLLPPPEMTEGNQVGKDSAETLLTQLSFLDGIIFSGGADHNPMWMNEEPWTETLSLNEIRDRHELPLCRLAYNRHIPMLGICRGMQTIAVALGGHVLQDIALPEHSQSLPKTETSHSVRLAEGSTLHRLYAVEAINVNSFHHQAVDDCGEKFRPVATAPDGTIEAMESAEHRQILGVQWHPEQLADDGLPIFRWLTEEARLFRKAKSLHRSMITLDSHCDTPMFFPQNVNFLSRDPRILYDLHKMDEGMVDAVQMVCYLPQNPAPEHPKAYADGIFDKIEDICRRSEGAVAVAGTPGEIIRNKHLGIRSIVPGIENGIALEHDLENISHFRRRGVTYITLCHNGDNDICDSARTTDTHGGLSPFGREVVREMNRQGMMADLSHAHERSFWDALECSAKPIVCSHSNCRALCDHPRNLHDSQMRALAEKGGVMQLTLYHGFLGEGKVSIDDFFRHLLHAIDIMGIDHVGIGTDFDGDGGVPGLSDASELIHMTERLLRLGFSDRDIAKIWGGNWLRVMRICME